MGVRDLDCSNIFYLKEHYLHEKLFKIYVNHNCDATCFWRDCRDGIKGAG